MSSWAGFALYPAWSLTWSVGLVSLRLGRRRGYGLPFLCFTQGIWLTALIFLVTPETRSIAGHIIPAGTLQAAGFVHAAEDLTGRPRMVLVRSVWLVSLLIALLGAVSPDLYYGPGVTGGGVLFIPFAFVMALASLGLLSLLLRHTLSAPINERRKFAALLCGSLLGALGGGGALGLFVLAHVSILIASPLMLSSTLMAAYATLGRETGRDRALVTSGIQYALVTGVFSAVPLALAALELPRLIPGSSKSAGLVIAAVLITFFALVPFDLFRQWVVDGIGRRISKSPIGVRDLATAIDKSENRADHAERLADLGAVVAAVAHEIRNPLGVMLAQAKLLERQGADLESIASLRSEIARARRFLDDLLRYGRPRPLQLARTDVLQLARSAARAAATSIAMPNTSIEVSGEPTEADADSEALSDVVTVLVHNALIASDGLAKVRVAVSNHDTVVRVIVEDDGPGVPPGIEARLFDAFVTGRGRDAAHPGTGLGLAIAARWAARHGGSIRHERPARGARFVFEWPESASVTDATTPPHNTKMI